MQATFRYQILAVSNLLRLVALIALFMTTVTVADAQTIGETPEIVYTSADAQLLRDTADKLGTAVAIYEYVHNTFEYTPYHGSRSGSVNTFLGQRGSDVDIASAMIAMLRYKNIPARYAVSTIRIPSAQIINWLGIPNLDVAIKVLQNQGIQGVVLSSDRTTVDMEHTWVEALVPYDQYRGINTVNPTVDCSLAANVSRCTWIALDGSFKQKIYNGLNIDPYNAVSFDYTAYYNAIKNNDSARKDKNPLDILEDQIGTWLRSNYPGKTLEDVDDAGKIIEVREGLLPASLPYDVLASIRRYDSVALHDAVVSTTEPKIWGKTLTIKVGYVRTLSGGGTISLSAAVPPQLLAEVTTKRLTITSEFATPTSALPDLVVRLGGVEIARPINISSNVTAPGVAIGTVITINLSMSGPPSINANADVPNTASYTGVLGGYYLIATGGESSNWSQVHRASQQLLDANNQYKVVLNYSETGCLADGTNCTPYYDANGNGYDSTDVPLLKSKDALDALTGGLLYVAASEYYAKNHDKIQRSDHLMKTITPIVGFLGVVSSTYEAEYVDGTAFSILPGGLLIDMKGMTFAGSYRTNETGVNFSNREFEFITHIASSLEHEIWQELTGYDAVSTVRGIQMALASGGSLINPKKSQSTDTVASLYSGTGFSSLVPSGFSATSPSLVIGTTAPATWTNAVSGATFETFDSVIGINATSLQRLYATYYYSTSNGLYGWSKCTSDRIADINKLSTATTYTWVTCASTPINGSPSQMRTQVLDDWYNNIIPNQLGQTFVDYFDKNKAFVTTNRMFRAYPPASNAIDTYTVATMRNDLYVRDTTKSWVEFVMPTTLVTGSTYRFGVNIRKEYVVKTTGDQLYSMTMGISNNGAVSGGGYIDLNHLDPFDNPLNSKKPLKNTSF